MKEMPRREGAMALAAAAALALLAFVLLAPAARADQSPAPMPLVTPVPLPAVPATEGYIIHPDDVLNVQVFGDSTLTETVTVLPSGDIQYPLIGTIHVAGQTPAQASASIASALHKYVLHPHVNVSIAQQGEINVLVLGGVQHPGKYQLTSSATMIDAIAAAGGLEGSEFAWPTARVTDYAGRVTQVDLQKIYHDGDLTQNVPVNEGSVVYVPAPATIEIEVTGAVDHPGEIDLNQGDRLSMAIAKAGNSIESDADLNHIHITRPTASGQPQTFNVDLYDELQHGDVDKDLVMQKGDVVFVPRSKHGLNGVPNENSDPVYLLLASLRDLFPHI
ncbi:MAG TPA: polysaccharide biosynthesis/export family protein [Candidatus Eremiobacteraceae bacterium]|nr:polysaccharide biosynthesis/export family protein [Candidatus Eremiobacteraceae bacterium]